MNENQISKTWREALVRKLQERYGLDEDESGQKADAWLRWIGEEPHPSPAEKQLPRRAKLKSRAAKRS
jgi:hypothetical protein